MSNNTHNCMTLLSDKMRKENICVCVICNKLLRTPIILIFNSGNACEACFKKKREKNLAKGTRNIALEFVVKELIFPCDFCGTPVKYSDLLEHRRSCRFQPIECLIDICKWLGNPADYQDHFKSDHGGKIVYPRQNNDHSFCFDLNIHDLTAVKDVRFLCGNSATSVIKVSNFYLYAENSDRLQFQICYTIYDILNNNNNNNTDNNRSRYLIKHASDVRCSLFEVTCKSVTLNKLNLNIIGTCVNIESLKYLSKDSIINVTVNRLNHKNK